MISVSWFGTCSCLLVFLFPCAKMVVIFVLPSHHAISPAIKALYKIYVVLKNGASQSVIFLRWYMWVTESRTTGTEDAGIIALPFRNPLRILAIPVRDRLTGFLGGDARSNSILPSRPQSASYTIRGVLLAPSYSTWEFKSMKWGIYNTEKTTESEEYRIKYITISSTSGT